MVNTNDILARLQAGESADAIAQEMVDALNAANAQYAEEKAANDVRAQKAEFVEEMADIVRDYILTFHADSYIAEMIKDQEIDPAEIVEMLDQSFAQLDQEIRKMKEIEKMFSGLMAKLDEHHPIAHPVDCDCGCADKATGKIEPNMDALAGFLKANGLA
jgi:tRNA U34 5-carboxymethylaminomethyl modifying enzyme MnmG/GidA